MKPNEAITFAEIEADNRDRESTHICGNCRAYDGMRSALPCKNDPARRDR